MTDERLRCSWCCDGGIVQKYHDTEWGVPLRDDQKQFEFLMMEVMQCGLNWTMMLRKRDIFRVCFDNFAYEKIAHYTEADIERILAVPGMIRSRRKITAVINNARRFVDILAGYHSFWAYLRSFSQAGMILYRGHETGAIPARTELSDRISTDLRKRGFKFLGSVTVYAHLQACGVVNDHVESCFRYRELIAAAGDQAVGREDNG
ncbi:MAG: DNA-3-methyladenine glycosylase I [Treponema sp.]|jgi:DNA-3-methyladenine glycosylase I|nr:DNA-3-methyladenine glycosylase I [Treponema sp.]